jgi:hypothetical protein
MKEQAFAKEQDGPLALSHARCHGRLYHNNNKHAYAGVNDCFTHLRALLVLHNTAAFWPTQLALLGITFLLLKSLKDWYFGSGSMTLALNTLLDLAASN